MVFAFERGSSMSTPRLSSGAVTMKMISSTSITSMYGTTLMSALSFLRLRWRVIVAVIRELLRLGGTNGVGRSLLDVRLALQDRRELLGETLVTHGQPL